MIDQKGRRSRYREKTKWLPFKNVGQTCGQMTTTILMMAMITMTHDGQFMIAKMKLKEYNVIQKL